MSLAAACTLVASAACLGAGAHPFVTYPLSLRPLARWRARPLDLARPGTPRSIALCVCAYNEQAVIAERIRNLLAVRNAVQDVEILVYIDGATDDTLALARRFEPQIRVVASPHRLGKTHGMNVLVGLARADILVFSDANVMFADGAVSRLVAPFADPAVGCVCGHLRYLHGDGETAATGSLYWRLEESIKALESATGSVMGADGSIFAVRRDLHVPPPSRLIDDMYVSLSVLCGGARIVRAADAYALETAVSASGEEFRRKIRIACQAFNVHRALWPALRRLPPLDLYKYVSHKLLRWLTVYFLAASLVLLEAGLALAGAWGAAELAALGICAAAACVAMARRGVLVRLREIAVAFIATGLGVAKSLRGEQFQTWTPPASSRAALATRSGGA